MSSYLFFKALHIIGFVSWFAALFYLVRLFVYHREAWDIEEPAGGILRKLYQVMEGRLYYIIQWPAMVITVAGGVAMLVIEPQWLQSGWMHLKLLLVLLLIIYHFYCGSRLAILRQSPGQTRSTGYRLLNELPTLLLIAIVMLAVGKQLSGLWMGGIVLVVLGLLFFAFAKWHKHREKNR